MSEEKIQETSGYVPAPEVPKADEERYRTLMLVIAGEMTVTDGAKRLGLSRVRFQTVMHRSMRALIAAATKKSPGRKPKPEREQTLEQEVARLRKENEKLTQHQTETDTLLGAASILLQERIGMRPRYRSRRKSAAATAEPANEDPAGEARWMLRAAKHFTKRLGSPELAAVALNVGASTVRRFALRARDGEVLVQHRGPGPKRRPSLKAIKCVATLVRVSEGLLGADTLRRSVHGISRREAAVIKSKTETAMERERKAAAVRVLIAVPGVLRGFDSLDLATTEGMRHFLACTDGCVPFRTSSDLVKHYDSHAVAKILDRDFTEDRAPLVLPDDPAKQHESPEVNAVLAKHGVLLLHGPPRYGQFYGQHERQNREHRGFLRHPGVVTARAVKRAIPRMLNVLNAVWKRASLGWKTSREVWMERLALNVDRAKLRAHVDALEVKIGRKLVARGKSAVQARRFAIEAALTQMGLLCRVSGGHR